MSVEERHTYVAHSCKLMSCLVGQEFSINKLSYNQLDLVYGVSGSLELQWWKEHVDDVTAGSEVGYVADWIDEKIAREEEERAMKEEECTMKEEERAMKEEERAVKEEERVMKEEEREWTKEFLAREEEGIQMRKKERMLVKELTPEERRVRINARLRERRRLLREKRALEKNAPTNTETKEGKSASSATSTASASTTTANASPEPLAERELEMKRKIAMVMSKPEEDWTEEDQKLIAAKKRRYEVAKVTVEQRRVRKNAREKERKRRVRGHRREGSVDIDRGSSSRRIGRGDPLGDERGRRPLPGEADGELADPTVERGVPLE
jgi:hypothetical protein